MNYKIRHKTEYSYTHPVNLCYNEARLTPRNFAYQACSESQFIVEPEPKECRERKDFFGNTVYYFTIQEPHNQLTVTVTSHVDVKGREHQRNFAESLNISGAWEAAHRQLHTDLDPEILEIRQYLLKSAMVPVMPELENYAEQSFTTGRPLLEAVEDLTARLYTDFTYDPGFTTIATPLVDVLKQPG